MRGEKNMPTRWEQARDSRVGWVWIFVLNFNVWGGTNTNGAGVSSTILYSFEPYFWIKIRYWVILFFKGLKPQLPAGTKQLNLLLAPKAVGPPSVMLEDRLRRVEIQSFWIFWGQKQWIFFHEWPATTNYQLFCCEKKGKRETISWVLDPFDPQNTSNTVTTTTLFLLWRVERGADWLLLSRGWRWQIHRRRRGLLGGMELPSAS
jgi:hypothetical protein